MTVLVVLIVAALLIVLVALPFGKREQVSQLLTDLDRTEDANELREAEEEVRDLDIMTTPEDANQRLPDWGPGAPGRRKR